MWNLRGWGKMIQAEVVEFSRSSCSGSSIVAVEFSRVWAFQNDAFFTRSLIARDTLLLCRPNVLAISTCGTCIQFSKSSLPNKYISTR
jgi:hypothetical protein